MLNQKNMKRIFAFALLIVGCSSNPEQAVTPLPTRTPTPSASASIPTPRPVATPKLTPQNIKIAKQVSSQIKALVKQGQLMEPLRQSQSEADLGKCGQLMRQNQAAAEALYSQTQLMPTTPVKFSLSVAAGNLPFCVACSSDALSFCTQVSDELKQADQQIKRVSK
jgi:hypothetical protein